jgi:hypothetical protein
MQATPRISVIERPVTTQLYPINLRLACLTGGFRELSIRRECGRVSIVFHRSSRLVRSSTGDVRPGRPSASDLDRVVIPPMPRTPCQHLLLLLLYTSRSPTPICACKHGIFYKHPRSHHLSSSANHTSEAYAAGGEQRQRTYKIIGPCILPARETRVLPRGLCGGLGRQHMHSVVTSV